MGASCFRHSVDLSPVHRSGGGAVQGCAAAVRGARPPAARTASRACPTVTLYLAPAGTVVHAIAETFGRAARGYSERAYPPGHRQMHVTLKPLHPVFAAECSGVDIGLPLVPHDAAAIDEGWTATRCWYSAARRRFRPSSRSPSPGISGNWSRPTPRSRAPRGNGSTIRRWPTSRIGPGDRILERDDRTRLFALGNQLWHSDSSFKPIPAQYSLLAPM